MAQRAKFIDLTRTFLPIDPNSLPETMHGTEGEDRPEQRMPVVPYEGWNFMPTGKGWRSYFGIASKLNIDALALPARVRDVFIFQEPDLTNTLVALCDTGIWTKNGEAIGAWVQAVALTDPDDGTLLEWSYCIIENILYVYRQAEDNVYTYEDAAGGWDPNVPTTLNMAGQLGIFKAGNRLGFWDSDNSIAWSSYEDKFNVTPDIATQANITKVVALVGKITNILQHGDGFVIYGTKSIVGVKKNIDSTFLWNAELITGAAGVAYRQQACIGAPDTTHFAWTSNSLHKIENFQGEVVVPELYDYLKESQSVIYLKMLEGRFLFVQLADAAYIDGQITFYTQTIGSIDITLLEARAAFDNMSDPVTTEVLTVEEQNALYSLFQIHPAEFAECTIADHPGPGYAVDVDYGHYVDHFVSPVSGSIDELASGRFINAAFTAGTTEIAGETINLLTDNNLVMTVGVNDPDGGDSEDYNNIAEYATHTAPTIIEEENDRNFFDKARALWDSYNAAANNYISKLDEQLRPIQDLIDADAMILIDDTPQEVPLAISNTGTLMGVDAFHPASDDPLALPGVEILYIAHIYHDFEYELGQVGCTYYCIARPTKVTMRRIEHSKASAFYEGYFSAEFVSSSGIIADVVNNQASLNSAMVSTGFGNNTYGRIAGISGSLEDALNFLVDGIVSSYGVISETIDYAVSGTASFKYNDNGTIVSVADPTGYNLTWDGTGTPVAVYGNQVTVTLTGTDSITLDPVSGTLTIKVKSSHLIADDTLTLIEDVEDKLYCNATQQGVLPVNQQYISYSHPDSFFRYNLLGGTYASPNTPPAYSEAAVIAQSICTLGTSTRNKPTVMGMGVAEPGVLQYNEASLTIDGISFNTAAVAAETFTYPGATFLMQAGTPAPYSVEFLGAYVYDTHYKRWGKMKNTYRQLLDFSPINSTALGTIDYTHFGVNAALFGSDGYIYMFDANPTDSYLKFGKIGNFRFGFTTLEEVRADFRRHCTGQLEIESSIDGLSVETGLTRTYNYTNARQVSQGIGNAGRWHNLAFKQQFDLTYLEFRAWLSSRR